MVALAKRLWTEEEGQGMAEYGLILALVAIAAIVALQLLGGRLDTIFTNVKEKMTTAT